MTEREKTLKEKVELKPCPFCGHQPKECSGLVLLNEEEDAYSFLCPNCMARGPEAEEFDPAVEAWNNRQALTALEERVEELESPWVDVGDELPEDFYEGIEYDFVLLAVQQIESLEIFHAIGYLDNNKQWRLINKRPVDCKYEYPTAFELGYRVRAWLDSSTYLMFEPPAEHYKEAQDATE